MFRTLISPGFWIKHDTENSPAPFKHCLGGADLLEGANSPNSGRPLLQIARLDTADRRLCLDDFGADYLYLLFGWTCDISQGPLVYEQLGTAIKILSYIRGEAYTDFPWPDYPDSFREVSVSLSQISEDEQKVLSLINESDDDDQVFFLKEENPVLAVPQHQIGGEPFLLGGKKIPAHCPKCEQEMSFLASIGNDNYISTDGFAGNEYVQVLYEICIACRVVEANQFTG